MMNKSCSAQILKSFTRGICKLQVPFVGWHRELGGVTWVRSCRELNFCSVGVSCALLPVLVHVSCRKLCTRAPLLKIQEMLMCVFLGESQDCDGRGGDVCKYERFDERYYSLHLE